MRVVDFIFKSTAFYRKMRFNLFIFLVVFSLVLSIWLICNLKVCNWCESNVWYFITRNIIKIQIDVLVEFRRNIHSAYIFNLPMYINNRYHWKHMAMRRESHCAFADMLLFALLMSDWNWWKIREKSTRTHSINRIETICTATINMWHSKWHRQLFGRCRFVRHTLCSCYWT